MSNFWTPLEIPLINCKIHVELNCILSSAGEPAKAEITDAKLHLPIVTLSTKDNVNLRKQVMDLKDLLEQSSDYSCKSNKSRKKHIWVTQCIISRY